MSADPVQVGTKLIVGIAGLELVGYITDNAKKKPTSDRETVKDKNGAAATHIFTDPRKELNIEMFVLDGTLPEDVKPGDAILVDGIHYMVTDVDTPRSAGAAMKVTFDCLKEDSMDYTPVP